VYGSTCTLCVASQSLAPECVWFASSWPVSDVAPNCVKQCSRRRRPPAVVVIAVRSLTNYRERRRKEFATVP
jgi:hypothetical protein